MHESGVIEDYLTALSAQLPAPIVEELADGLDETRQRYLRQGLDAEARPAPLWQSSATPDVILADFARQSPARRSSPQDPGRRTVVGGCWGVALITRRAWAWPVRVGRLLLGVALRSYRFARCRRVREVVPFGRPGRSSRVCRHDRARYPHACHRCGRCPRTGMAGVPGRRGERCAPYLHHVDSAYPLGCPRQVTRPRDVLRQLRESLRAAERHARRWRTGSSRPSGQRPGVKPCHPHGGVAAGLLLELGVLAPASRASVSGTSIVPRCRQARHDRLRSSQARRRVTPRRLADEPS